MNIRRTQMLLTAVGMVAIGAMEVYVPSVAQTADPTQIVVKDFMFSPTPLTIKVGSIVTWTNKDDEPHTVVSDTGVFKSGGMDTNESFSYKFLIHEWTIDLCRVEQGDASVNRTPQHRDHLLLCSVDRTMPSARSHTAQTDSRNYKSTSS